MRRDMGSRLEILVFGLALFTAVSVADDDSGLCKMVACGKGSCNVTSSGFLIDVKIPRCECQPGWRRPSIVVSLPFLPCVIPNCTLDAGCTKKAPSSAPSLEPSSNSTGLIHPCELALCGGGSCEKTSEFGYRCNCEAGYENLLNMTAGPCVRECSLGADCSNIGINIGGNASTNPPPAQADTSGTTSSNTKGSPTPTPTSTSLSTSGGGKSFSSEIAMAVLNLCVLLLYR